MDTIDLGSTNSSCDPCLDVSKDYMCKPCQDESEERFADGWCKECEEYMCSTCFRHHRKSKFCKEHELLNVKPTSAKDLSQSLDGLEKCQKHINESVKFYCAFHEVCGCSDCMILDHKTCDVAYIPKIAVSGEKGEEFKTFAKDLESYRAQIKSCVSNMKSNNNENEKAHENFIADVEEFREAIINHVNKLAAELCAKSTDTKEQYTQKHVELLNEAKNVQTELETITERLKANKGQPNKLFVSIVEMKRSLKQMSSKILHLKKRSVEEKYCFQKDSLLDSILVKCDRIGEMKTSSELTQENDELDAGSDSLLESTVPENKKICHLQDLKLRSECMQLDKNTLTYVGLGDLNGVYIANIRMTSQRYFEVEILNDSIGGSVAIGLVPKNFARQKFPGWTKDSIGYHSDDGCIFNGNEATPIARCGQFDKMGCGILEIKPFSVEVTFTKNGRKIGEYRLQTSKDLFPVVALDTDGQKVRVVFDAQIPVQ